jgi:5-methylthioadenosine/S-adenosylhomocysteine deaminase
VSEVRPVVIRGAVVGDEVVDLRLADGVVAAVGPDLAASPGDEVFDGTGCVALPGLVNGHTHASMTLFRGYGDDLPLMEWLERWIWPAEQRLEAEDVYWGARLAMAEMLRTGTTHLVDMYWHPEAVARAAVDAGIRATTAAVFFDGGDAEAGRRQRPQVLDTLDALADAGPLVRPAVGPHAVYTVSGDSLAWLAEVADERALPIHIHLSETADEVTRCRAEHGESPAAWLDRLGGLSERTVAAHGCWLDDADLALVAERRATVVTNPVSNMKLATGRTFPYPAAVAAGVPVGLGTDGASSNNGLDLLADLKVLALAQKHAADDPAVLPAEEALAVATGQRSAVLGGRPLEVGAPADVALVRVDGLGVAPSAPAAGLVYAATGAHVEAVVVAGRVRVRHGRVEGIDEILAEVRHRAARLRR